MVADVDRACAFYRRALGGQRLVYPVEMAGPGADRAIGSEGVRLRVAMVGFDNAMLELFELVGPKVPAWAGEPRRGPLPHVALEVDDTDAALARIEAAGGKRLWDDIDEFGDARVIYAADPDDNVIELVDRPPSRIAALFHQAFPESRPATDNV